MKIIIVPKDLIAQEKLNYNQCGEGDLIELRLDDHIFNKLWTGGFFKGINKLTNSIIDNYEDEQITEKEKLEVVLKSGVFNNSYDDELIEIVNKIKYLFEQALERKTGVHFYF